MAEFQSDSNITFTTYTNKHDDPEYLLKLIDKYVHVELIKNTNLDGFVHSIDPITSSIILYVPREEIFQITLIPGHAILNITETTPSLDKTIPLRKSNVINENDLNENKIKLIAWLKHNLLNVDVNGDSIVLGNARILPPYTGSDISADNVVVAMQIKKLIENIPKDFKSK